MAPDRSAVQIAIICALTLEADAVEAIFDEIYPPSEYGKNPNDQNTYTVGRIDRYDVVLAWMPGVGKVNAATVATHLLYSFHDVKVALMVGICGGVPDSADKSGIARNIYLGDVIISNAVVQYDHGWQYPDTLKAKDTMQEAISRPPMWIRSLTSKILGIDLHRRLTDNIQINLAIIQEKLGTAHFAGIAEDHLFPPSYRHKHRLFHCPTCSECINETDPVCEAARKAACEDVGCDIEHSVVRRRTTAFDSIPALHVGAIASGDSVMMSARHRDEIARKQNVIAFEMEGAGIWDNLPCIVIKGVSDYCDSHKNGLWKNYAAAVAAACAKALLQTREIETRTTAFAADAIPAQDPKTNECLQELQEADPEAHMKKIIRGKDPLLRECYEWIFNDENLKQWESHNDRRLLWIRGDPGKGKTMLMIALVQSLSRTLSTTSSNAITYFFCQSTDAAHNNAVSVLRGLIWKLAHDRPHLARHIRKKYDHIGKDLFTNSNALDALFEILTSMLQDRSLESSCVLIDALDECEEGRLDLLELIKANASSRGSKTKWLLSSRNTPDIEESLSPKNTFRTLSLELNAEHISQAVIAFVSHKTAELAARKQYSTELKAEVQSQLARKADSTFLWVSLATKRLEKVKRWKTLDALEELPPGLQNLYSRMMSQVLELDDDEGERADCLRILRAVVLTRRPLSLQELVIMAELDIKLPYEEDRLQDTIQLCGSFVTIRESVAYLIHQSVKDYFILGEGQRLFLSRLDEEHGRIFRRSLEVMSSVLRRNMCKLKGPGDAPPDIISNAQLAAIEYACCFWAEHLVDFVKGKDGQDQRAHATLLSDGGQVSNFLNQHLLSWFEALGLLRKLSRGAWTIHRLELLVEIWSTSSAAKLSSLLKDARLFIMQSLPGIEAAPLQVYSSALVFAPSNSIIRRLFHSNIPSWIKLSPKVQSDWGPLLQKLTDHRQTVWALDLSSDGNLMASVSGDRTVKLWWLATGTMQHSLRGHTECINAVSFSHDNRLVASASDDCTLKTWDAESGQLQRTFKGHDGSVVSVEFSPDNSCLASASSDRTVRLWNTSTGQLRYTLGGHVANVYNAVFLDQDTIISSSEDGTVGVWSVSSGMLQHFLEAHTKGINSIAISPDGSKLAAASGDTTVSLWDARTYQLSRVLGKHEDAVNSVSFSFDGTQLASASDDQKVHVWCCKKSVLLFSLAGHSESVRMVTFAKESYMAASASDDRTIKLWDTKMGNCIRTLRGHTDSIWQVCFLPGGEMAVSASSDCTLRLWNVSPDENEQNAPPPKKSYLATARTILPRKTILPALGAEPTLPTIQQERHTSKINGVAFSPTSTIVATASDDGTIGIWNVKSGKMVRALTGHQGPVNAVLFTSSDGKFLASASTDHSVVMWNVDNGSPIKKLLGHSGSVTGLALSNDGKLLGSTSDDHTVRIWNYYARDEKIVVRRPVIPAPQRSARPSVFLPKVQSTRYRNISISDDANLVLFSRSTNELCIYSMKTRNTTQLPKEAYIDGLDRNVSFSQSGRWFVAKPPGFRVHLRSTEGLVAVAFDIPTTLSRTDVLSNGSSSTLVISPDDNQIALAGGSCVWIFDLPTSLSPNSHGLYQPHTWFAELDSQINILAFSADSNYLAMACSTKVAILAMDVKSIRYEVSMEGINAMAFSTSGVLALQTGNAINLVSVDSGRLIKKLVPLDMNELMPFSPLIQLTNSLSVTNRVKFSPNGQYLVSISQQRPNATLWDTVSGLEIKHYDPTALGDYAVSWDGEDIAITRFAESGSLSVKSLDPPLRRTFMGHQARTTVVAFDQDNSRIASASSDGMINVWSQGNGTVIESFRSAKPTQLAFSADGEYLATDMGSFGLDGQRRFMTAKLQVNLGVEGSWLVQNDKRVLWLPDGYRITQTDAKNNVVAFGLESGLTAFLQLSQHCSEI